MDARAFRLPRAISAADGGRVVSGARAGAPVHLAFALTDAAALRYFRQEPAPTLEWAERTIALANQHGFPFWPAFGTMLRGWAFAERGKTREGIAEIRRGLAAWRMMGTELGRPYFLTMLGEAHARAGQIAEALATLDEAKAIVESSDYRSYEAVDVTRRPMPRWSTR